MFRRCLRLAAIAVSMALVAIAALVARQAPAGEATPRRATGAISGVVTDAATGHGLGGVIVGLSGTGVPISMKTVTDSRGRFVFEHLPAYDRYYLSASRPGYLAGGLARRHSNMLPTPFALDEDEWIKDANLVMSRPGGISGIVVDERGEPMVDLPVRVLTRIPIAGRSYWARGAVARTDDRGHYRIAGLWPGSYIVNVPSVYSTVPPGTPAGAIAGLAPGAAAPSGTARFDVSGAWLIGGPHVASPDLRRIYPVMFHPGSRTFAGAAPLELGPGEERRGIDFSLAPEPAMRVHGRIVGPPDAVGDLVVRALLDDAPALGAGSEQATARVASDGGFTLAGLPAGRYLIEATTGASELAVQMGPGLGRTPGLVADVQGDFLPWLPDPLATAFLTRFAAGRDGYFARLPLAVRSEDISGVELRLERAGTIQGRIVRDDGPLPGRLTIRAEPASGDPRLGGASIDQIAGTTSVGQFAVRGVVEGEYFLRVAAGNLRVKSIAHAGAEYADRPFQIAAGQDVDDVVVTLTGQSATVAGLVRDVTGAVVRRAAVIVFPRDAKQWTDFGVNPPRIRSVLYLGSRGYEVAGLPAGEYLVAAVDEGMRDAWQDPRFLPAIAPRASGVTLGWGASVAQDVVLQPVILK